MLLHPTANSGFFLKSPLQERCEALESELSSLRARLRRSERSSTVREKRLSIFQQQSTDAHHVLNTLRQQHEVTVDQLKDAQREMAQAKTQLQSQKELIQRLEAQTRDQESQLKDVLVDRDSLSMEMMEAHSDNAKFLKRLHTSTDKVEKLQLENRHLIEQLRELRAKVVAVSDEKLELSEILDRERHRGNQASLELERVVARYKAEVEKLQDLVLMMGNRHVQVQAQLQFLQQQAQQHFQQRTQQQQIVASSISTTNEHKALVRNSVRSSTNITTTPPTSTSKHGSLMLGDGAIASILASVATSSASRRSKPTRRFTVNASHQEAPLTLEQRKCEFLMDQITVLQRGYDTLRQEKVTLELQVDLMQRQHQYHQQQRQKRRDSQRRTLGSEQSAQLSAALANMGTVASPGMAPQSPFATSGPLSILTKIPSSEELKQAQLRAQKELEAQEKEKERLAAEAKRKAAAEEAARQEAIRMKKIKDLHLKEALASLESKRGRSDSRNVTFTSSEELKHLEHLRLTHAEEKGPMASLPNSAFQSAANARASRRIAPPKAVTVFATTSTPPPSPFFASAASPFFSSSSPLTTAPTPASSFSSAFAPEAPVVSSSSSSSSSSSPLKQVTHTPYTHASAGPARAYNHSELDIQQCSCCIGSMIEI
ncbi:hypothetical protein BG006_005867 [Podila minutissima]|uniref:Uncharacterized protein n=1 Tax=Podila minutissima TaxID=64525 RepID=A0A9P5SKA4_9FUNG|nr:hypothetical protein BG006_005867 [Podila minutissima]